MKNTHLIAILTSLVFITSCKKVIDIDPISNIGTNAFYRDYSETNTALTGCYNGIHQPLYIEWMFTELRGDNSKQGSAGSTAIQNIELNELDMFTVNSAHDKVYDYWLATYRNIRAINYVLRSLGVKYVNGELSLEEPTAKMTEQQRNQIMGEALFLRAYHYFNLVRLFGGVFLITEPLDPKIAKQINRSSVNDCYRLIIADLTKAKDILPNTSFAQINQSNLGHANTWAAKSLLAKVYLTNNQSANALLLLDDVINNSGYGLLPSYADVFSINNEMNREIIFAVRYKAGGFGLGSPFANLFAPSSSGSSVVNNDGNGFNFPTESVKAAYRVPATGPADQRRNVNIAQYTATRPYMKKYLSQVITRYDAENDFPVIRFADVLLMKAEAMGFDGADGVAVGLINSIRQRAGAADYTGTGAFEAAFFKYPATGNGAILDAAAFKSALFNERRIELAYENQRYFDMLRSGDAVNAIRTYFAAEYDVHYRNYRPVISLAELQGYVNQNRLLLPIPQREIDTNDELKIEQNPGY
ncbi:MAG: RagB/SusD family nutrient uptake outer membrane protein [Pedobacter sp.]|uniref:RagB/SusD family nutrient uptake outer membrane protein n=1 Tax=Pedobacter sp. TaxID=1411316 RepID=UPI002806E3BB|nr:RagB/SusD family nutrient uptake outer membrane protein [Pedobacter sp.]MDQ8003334.1 RagB/SusD family nutrient uptake outer membrane protein [Pedobacter sp.]